MSTVFGLTDPIVRAEKVFPCTQKFLFDFYLYSAALLCGDEASYHIASSLIMQR